MKKVLFIAGLIFMSSANAAWAITGPSLRHFDALYTTTAYGSYTEKNSFSLDETPWLYAKLPEVQSGDVTSLLTNWVDGGTASLDASEQNTDAIAEFWLTPSDWDAVKHAGPWDIKTYFAVDKPGPLAIGDLYGGSEVSPQVTNPYRFTVTPEPVSAVLFLLGGSALGLATRKRYVLR